jgi:hypothetical protein
VLRDQALLATEQTTLVSYDPHAGMRLMRFSGIRRSPFAIPGLTVMGLF